MSTKPPKDMKSIAAMLVCPHAWSEPRNVRVMPEPGKKGKPRNGMHSICGRCGTNKVEWGDGTSTMFSPDRLSDEPQT